MTQKTGLAQAYVNLRVGTKVGSGFGAILVVLAAIAGVSYFGLVTIKTDFDLYVQHVDEQVVVMEVERDFLDLRRHVQGYAASRDKQEADAAVVSLDAVRKTINKGLATVAEPTSRQKLQEIASNIESYAKLFGEVVAKQNELTRLLAASSADKMATAVQDIATLAARNGNADTQLLAFEALQNVMTLQLSFNKFLAVHDEADAAAAERANAAFIASLARLDGAIRAPDQRAKYDEVRTLQAAYSRSYLRSEDLAREVAALIGGEMRDLAQEATAAALELKEEFHDEEVAVGEELEAVVAAAELESILLAAIGLVLGISAAILIGRAISRPVVGMTAAMQLLASGDKSALIPGVSRKDEIGEMAAAVQVFKDNMIRAAQLDAEQRAEQVSKEARAKKVDAYIAEFEKTVAGVLQIVSSSATELQTTAQSMSATAEQTSKQATAVAAASEEASTNIQTVASASEELSSSVAEISRQVAESAKVSGVAVEAAARTNAQITALAEAAKRIGEVVNLINEVASQTNLLALNATIEAARAGEAGKGFAVVASEVKSLAAQTAKATDEISSKIAEMQSATSQSVQAIHGITKTISDINGIATAIASAVEEQGAATQEIARNMQQASAGAGEVSSNIAGVTTAANDTGAAASQVLGASSELAKQAEVLTAKVSMFLGNIRAA